MASRKADKSVIDFSQIKPLLDNAKDDTDLFQIIVNAPFNQKVGSAFLFLGIITLRLVNREKGIIEHVAISSTDQAKSASQVSIVPFKKIKIPLNTRGNVISLAIVSGKPQDTTDWRFLFTPVLSAEAARIDQASAGIAYSVVYPFKARDGGAIIYSYYQYESGISREQRDFMARYTILCEKALQTT